MAPRGGSIFSCRLSVLGCQLAVIGYRLSVNRINLNVMRMKRVFALSLYFSYFTFLFINNFIRFIFAITQNEKFTIVIWGFDCRSSVGSLNYDNKAFIAIILFVLTKLTLFIFAHYLYNIYKLNFYLISILKLIISSYIFDVLSVISRLTNNSFIDKIFYSNFPLFKFNTILEINQLVIPFS
jgi:hypothetical protein